MPSCDAGKEHINPMNPSFRPEDFYELHHNIRPTKPIRIPDTMRVATAYPEMYKLPQDSTLEFTQDSIPQDTIAY